MLTGHLERDRPGRHVWADVRRACELCGRAAIRWRWVRHVDGTAGWSTRCVACVTAEAEAADAGDEV